MYSNEDYSIVRYTREVFLNQRHYGAKSNRWRLARMHWLRTEFLKYSAPALASNTPTNLAHWRYSTRQKS